MSLKRAIQSVGVYVNLVSFRFLAHV